jgi:uncharacterized repeat protein (TIGR01451 family)
MALTVGSGSRRALAQPGEALQAEKAEPPPKVEPLPEPAPLPVPEEVAPAASPKPDPPEPGSSSPPVEAEPVEPPEPLPPAPPLPPPAGKAEKPTEDDPPAEAQVDREVERVQGPDQGSPALPAPVDGDPLPPAQEPPGGAPPAASAGASGSQEPFVLPADRVPLGAQAVGLTVDVQAPPLININLPATFKIVVKNTGMADATGVVVRDELPEGVEFLSSQPEARPADRLLFWKLSTIPAGTQQVITLRVKPTRTGSLEHAATVTMMAASKSRTMVRQPQLKVEVSTTPKPVLKGQPAQFKIAVSNPGDGVARNVSVQARLSPGLRHEESGGKQEENVIGLSINQILAGETINLEPLIVDTTQGGEQSCTVTATSPDVFPTDPAGAQNTKVVTVVAPELKLNLAGPKERYTNTVATYTLKVSNPGTAPARNVRVLATLPINGRLIAQPADALPWDKNTRRLQWQIPQLDPEQEVTFTCQVRMGGIDLYQVAVEARAEGALMDQGTIPTTVTGMADVVFDITEPLRVVDVGEEIIYRVNVKNVGSKDATRLQISAELSENLEPIEYSGVEEGKKAKFDPANRKLVLPEIARLGAGKEIPLAIKVKATKTGGAFCRVALIHADLQTKLEGMAVTTVTASRTR